MADTQKLVGTAEILDRHGIPRHRVFRFRNRGLWPEPVARLRRGDVWDANDVQAAVDRLRASGQL